MLFLLKFSFQADITDISSNCLSIPKSTPKPSDTQHLPLFPRFWLTVSFKNVSEKKNELVLIREHCHGEKKTQSNKNPSTDLKHLCWYMYMTLLLFRMQINFHFAREGERLSPKSITFSTSNSTKVLYFTIYGDALQKNRRWLARNWFRLALEKEKKNFA